MNIKKKGYQNKLKKVLIYMSTLSFISAPFLVNSCSSTQTTSSNEVVNQQFVNQQFDKFQEAIINDSILNNLYFENFNFNDQNIATLSLNEIQKFLSFENISDFFNSTFTLEKKLATNEIVITLNLQNNGHEYKPTDLNKSIYVLKNVKSFTDLQTQEVGEILNSFVSNKDTYKIVNAQSEILNKSNYCQILPSYLTIKNFDFNTFSTNPHINDLLTKNNLSFDYVFNPNDVDGTINIKLFLVNKITKLKYFVNVNSLITLSGFCLQKNRDAEVLEIYKSIGKTYNVFELAKKNLPFFPSTVYDINQLKIFLNQFKTEYPEFILPTYFDPQTNVNSLWYDLNIEPNANDTNGILNIKFKILDKFTKTPIEPENVVKIMTFTNMLKLSLETSNGSNDYSSTENLYKAYSLFKELKINNGYSIYARDGLTQIPTIDINWLKANTNILTIIPDINANGEFTCKSKIYNNVNQELVGTEKINKFKIRSINKEQAKINDENGIIKFPLILDIEFDVNGAKQWVSIMPPSSKTNSGDKVEFGNAKVISYLEMGGYRTVAINQAASFYNYINSNQTIEIGITNQGFFNSLVEEVRFQNQLIEKIKYQLDEKFKEIVSSVFVTNDEKNQFLSKFTYFFDLKEQNMIFTTDPSNNVTSFETSLVDFKIVSKSNDQEFIPYYPLNGSETPFPKSKIVVKFVQTT